MTALVAASPLSRHWLFAGLCVLGFVNGIANQVIADVVRDGLFSAIADTFGVSVIVWIAFAACPALLLDTPNRAPASRADIAIASLCVAMMLVPVAWTSWVALTGLGFHLLLDKLPRNQPSERRAAWVLLGIVGAMFWGRWAVSFGGERLLDADAALIGWLVGADHAGNTVRFADGAGFLWIAPACSSLANVPLAVLGWVLFAQTRGLGASWAQAGWCLAGCMAVIVINVARLSLMVLRSQDFDTIHGPLGAGAVNWLTLVVLLAIFTLGTRRSASPAH